MRDCWASPVVVGDHVYVGCGEGEGGAFGFVYCLYADTGHVKWLSTCPAPVV
jgi:outer membrane protein assembly factor BamB